jgi:hypothetical protein
MCATPFMPMLQLMIIFYFCAFMTVKFFEATDDSAHILYFIIVQLGFAVLLPWQVKVVSKAA